MRKLSLPSAYAMGMKLLNESKYEELEEYFCSLDPLFLEYFVYFYSKMYEEEEEAAGTVFFDNII